MSMNIENLALTPVWADIRRGPLDETERQAAIAVCGNALQTWGRWDMAAASAIGLLEMLGLYRPQEK